MTPFDYITDIALIGVVVLQMRVRTLTLRSLLLPLGLVAGAGIAYLRPISLAGNNFTLIAVLVAAGLTLGTLSGMTITSGVRATVFWPAPASSLPSSGYLGWEHASPSPSGSPTPELPRSDASRSTTTSPVGTFGSSLGAHGLQRGLSRIGVLQFRRIRAEHAPGSLPADRGGADNPRLVTSQAA